MAPSPAPTTPELVGRVVTAWRAIIATQAQPVVDLGVAPLADLSMAVFVARGQATLTETFVRHPVVPHLERLLETDAFLQQACRDVLDLARGLELCLFELVPVGLRAAWFKAVPDSEIVRLLTGSLFEESYVRRLYFRLFNVLSERPAISLAPAMGCTIRILREDEVVALTGEWTVRSALLPSAAGSVFLVFEDDGSGGPDAEWVQARQNDAGAVLQVLRYLKYENVEIDSTLAEFRPRWLTRLRWPGLRVWGNPRKAPAPRPYTLTTEVTPRLLRLLTARSRFQAQLEDLSSQLRKITSIAGDFYESSHGREKPDDQLIDLVIALETLFSPKGGGGELSFRVALNAALFLGETPASRISIAGFLKRITLARNALVHGGKSAFGPDGSLTQADLATLGEHIRQGILRMTVLYLRKKHSRDAVMEELQASIFDSNLLAKLQGRSHFETFLTEQGL